jgi:hypothetical protein
MDSMIQPVPMKRLACVRQAQSRIPSLPGMRLGTAAAEPDRSGIRSGSLTHRGSTTPRRDSLSHIPQCGALSGSSACFLTLQLHAAGAEDALLLASRAPNLPFPPLPAYATAWHCVSGHIRGGSVGIDSARGHFQSPGMSLQVLEGCCHDVPMLMVDAALRPGHSRHAARTAQLPRGCRGLALRRTPRAAQACAGCAPAAATHPVSPPQEVSRAAGDDEIILCMRCCCCRPLAW